MRVPSATSGEMVKAYFGAPRQVAEKKRAEPENVKISSYCRALVSYTNTVAARSSEADSGLVELGRRIVAGWSRPSDDAVDRIMRAMSGEA